jgi:NAD(P)H dehydrogenase (quinone)
MDSARKRTVLVVYYSMYGHIQHMARAVCKGLEKAGGKFFFLFQFNSFIELNKKPIYIIICFPTVTVKLTQVQETLPEEVLAKMHAPPKAGDVPIVTLDDLKNADGILWGIPTRFGMVPAQIKAFMDQTGQLWMSGGL